MTLLRLSLPFIASAMLYAAAFAHQPHADRVLTSPRTTVQVAGLQVQCWSQRGRDASYAYVRLLDGQGHLFRELQLGTALLADALPKDGREDYVLTSAYCRGEAQGLIALELNCCLPDTYDCRAFRLYLDKEGNMVRIEEATSPE